MVKIFQRYKATSIFSSRKLSNWASKDGSSLSLHKRIKFLNEVIPSKKELLRDCEPVKSILATTILFG